MSDMYVLSEGMLNAGTSQQLGPISQKVHKLMIWKIT